MGLGDRTFLLGATLPERARRTVVALVFVAHAIVFWLGYADLGVRVLGPLSVLPVIVAAWLLGARGGALAGLLVLVLNTVLIAVLAGGSVDRALLGRNALNYAVLIAIGALVGWLRDLNVRVREQARQIEEQAWALAEQARLDGALKTARLAAHELNNRLQVVRTYGEMLPRRADPDTAAMARGLATAAAEAGAIMDRLQGIIRFEETTLAGVPVLDLEASTRTIPSDGDPRPAAESP